MRIGQKGLATFSIGEIQLSDGEIYINNIHIYIIAIILLTEKISPRFEFVFDFESKLLILRSKIMHLFIFL